MHSDAAVRVLAPTFEEGRGEAPGAGSLPEEPGRACDGPEQQAVADRPVGGQQRCPLWACVQGHEGLPAQGVVQPQAPTLLRHQQLG